MSIKIEEGKSILIDTITKKKFHKHYDRVTELAELYRKLITGDKINTLLKQFVKREDSALFAQRELLTHAITPSVSSSLMTPFHKVGRVNSIVKKISFKDSKENDVKLKHVEEALVKYNGDKSLHRYLEERLVDLNFTDPNSYIITEFDAVPVGPSGQMTAKVSPRPFECSSAQAINMFYKNNILQWLIVKLDITYKQSDGKEIAGHSYTIYLEDDAIKFTQIDSTDSKQSVGNYSKYQIEGGSFITHYRASERELFLVEEFNYKTGRVPAIRVGYKLDLTTDGATCVNPMHDALPYFMKSIKTVSEFDLTMALHAFPQKFQYVNKCSGQPKIGCDSGKTPEGGNCGACHGSGFAIQTSAQDAIVMRIPKDPKDMIDMGQLVHYEYPPIDLLKFQDEFIKGLKNEARQAVFNSEIFSKTQVANTAFEVKISLDSVYDTLFPFAEQFSKVYKYNVEIIAQLVDVNDVVVDHKFPKDFKFKGLTELLADLAIANTSNAPGYVRQEISADIAEQQFIDKPEELKKIRAKQRFFPFPDKTPTEIIYIISNNKTTQYSDVLWANFESIFQDLESEANEINLNFYDYAYTKQKELIEAKVDSYLVEIDEEAAPKSSPFADTEDNGGG